jgi:hypothetical protein
MKNTTVQSLESENKKNKQSIFASVNMDYVLLVVATLTLIAVIVDLVIDKHYFKKNEDLTKEIYTSMIELQKSKTQDPEVSKVYNKINELLEESRKIAEAAATSTVVDVSKIDLKLQLAYPASVLESKILNGADLSEELSLIRKGGYQQIEQQLKILEEFSKNPISVHDIQRDLIAIMFSDVNLAKKENKTFSDTFHEFFKSILSIESKENVLNEKILNDRITSMLELLNFGDVQGAYYLILKTSTKHPKLNEIESKIKTVQDAIAAANQVLNFILSPL